MKKADLEQLKAAIAELPADQIITLNGVQIPNALSIRPSRLKALIADHALVTDQRDRLVEHLRYEAPDCDFIREIATEIEEEE